MPSKTYINKFPEGLDKDSDDKIKKNTTYKDAHHVELSGDNKYGAVQNLKGTTLVSTILSTVTYSTINVMGAFKARTFIVDDTDVEDCIYIFYAKNVSSVYTFVVDLFRPSNDTVYNIFSSVGDSSIMSISIDAFVVGEGGVDTLYFTTNLLPPGRIRCVLESTPAIVARQQELFKRYPSNSLTVSSILYNIKGDSPPSDIHNISLDGVFSGGSLVGLWTGTAPLDSDTQGGDSFNITIDWDIEYRFNADTGTDGIAASIDVKYPESGSSVAGFPKTTTPFLVNDSDSGTEVILANLVPYNSDPLWVEITARQDTFGDPFAWAQASVTITAIAEVTGGDTYNLGSVLNRTVLR